MEVVIKTKDLQNAHRTVTRLSDYSVEGYGTAIARNVCVLTDAMNKVETRWKELDDQFVLRGYNGDPIYPCVNAADNETLVDIDPDLYAGPWHKDIAMDPGHIALHEAEDTRYWRFLGGGCQCTEPGTDTLWQIVGIAITSKFVIPNTNRAELKRERQAILDEDIVLDLTTIPIDDLNKAFVLDKDGARCYISGNAIPLFLIEQ